MSSVNNLIDSNKILSVEALNLEEMGYGPEGLHTRRQWREQCLSKYLSGDDAFLEWQNSWYLLAKNNNKQLYFSVAVKFESGHTQIRELFAHSYALDFSAINLSLRKHTKDIFLVTTLFHSTTFINPVYLIGTTFKEKVVFDFVIFSNDIRLDKITFNRGASFISTTFLKQAWFVEAKFIQSGVFIGAIFYDYVSFDSAVFTLGATFLDVRFFSPAWFKNTIFEWDARFDKAIFKESALFNNVTFNTIAGFSKATFSSKETCFIKTHFKSESWFQEAKFLEASSFENAEFDNVGHFEKARFNFASSKIPSFRGCQIGKTRLEFSDDTNFTQNDFSEEAIKNISFLKRLSDEHGQLDQALNFNAMELHAKRKLALEPLTYIPPDRLIFDGVWWETLPTGLYGYLSNYGRSFTRPLVALIILAIMTWIIVIAHAIYNSPPPCKNKQQSWLEDLVRDGAPCFINSNDSIKPQLHLSGYRAAFEYSVYRTSNLVDFTDADKQTQAVTQRLFGSQIEPMWMRVYGIFKAILSAILLFLTALGLRNKYRIS